MMDSDEFRAIVADGFAESGLSPTAANRMAEFIDNVTRIRVAAELHRVLLLIRPTVIGTCLLRILEADPEGLREAARRLHISPAGLLKQERRIRELVNTPVKLTAE